MEDQEIRDKVDIPSRVFPKPISTQPKKKGGLLPQDQVERGHTEPPLTGKISSCLGCEAKNYKGK